MVKAMIYCKIKDKTDKHAIYAYGVKTDELDGEFFVSDKLEFRIIKHSKAGNLNYWLGKLIYKYRYDFNNKIFRDKISYEC